MQPCSRITLTAVLVEGGLGLFAVGMAWLLNVPLYEQIRWEWNAAVWGSAAAVPALAIAILGMRVPWEPLVRLRRLVQESIVPLFQGCSLFDFIAIATVAGIGEELLFRGLLQGWLAKQLGNTASLCVASFLFGVAHPISRTYVILATAMGLWLGGLWLITGNLLSAIVCHAVYDLFALIYLVRSSTPAHVPLKQ